MCCHTTPGPVRLLYDAATVVYASPCVVKYYSLYFCNPVLQSLDLPDSPDLNPMTRHGHSASKAWCQAADRAQLELLELFFAWASSFALFCTRFKQHYK